MRWLLSVLVLFIVLTGGVLTWLFLPSDTPHYALKDSSISSHQNVVEPDQVEQPHVISTLANQAAISVDDDPLVTSNGPNITFPEQQLVRDTTPQPKLTDTQVSQPLNRLLRELVDLANKNDINGRFLLAKQIQYCWAYHDEKRIAEQNGNMSDDEQGVFLNGSHYSKDWSYFCDQVSEADALALLQQNIQAGDLHSALEYYHLTEPVSLEYQTEDEYQAIERTLQYRENLLDWAFENGRTDAVNIKLQQALDHDNNGSEIVDALALHWLLEHVCQREYVKTAHLEKQVSAVQLEYAQSRALELFKRFTTSRTIDLSGC